MESDSSLTMCIPLSGGWMQMEKVLCIHSIQLEAMRGNNVVPAELLLLSSCPSLIIRCPPYSAYRRCSPSEQVNFKNQYLPNGEPHPITKLPLDKVIKLVKDAFASATERHIEVGDGLEIYIVDRNGVRVERSELKKD